MIRLLIAGEGPNELGQPTALWTEGPRAVDGGVIEALMAKVRGTGWQVRDSWCWSQVHKLRPNAAGQGEEKTIRGLALRARELGCNALVFLRDRDGDRARERVIRDVVESLPDGLAVAAGVPVEMIECWLLSLRGEAAAHADPTPAASLELRQRVPQKRTAPMVQLIRNARLLDAPADARSLWKWLRRVAVVLNVTPIPASWPRP